MPGPALALVLICLLLIAGCTVHRSERPGLNSISWMQGSEEYRALALGAYNTARHNLDDALADVSWSALPSQTARARVQSDALANLPPAVVLDIDETVLSTLPYQAGLVKDGLPFDALSWNTWISRADAKPLPGAVEFIRYAMQRGVTVFYLTNRSYSGPLDVNADGRLSPDEHQASLKNYTLSNLVNLGLLPQNGIASEDALLMRGEPGIDGQVRPGWSDSDKTARRESLAADYRVMLLIGDTLGDFIGHRKNAGTAATGIYRAFGGDIQKRRQMLLDYRQRWGRSWIMLPNPLYGHWESSLYDFEYGLPAGERNRLKLDALDSWQ